jgi:geranylgeranyl diphosphate synthase, type II
MELKDFLDQNLILIEQQLKVLIPTSEAPYRQLFDAAQYSTLGKGKRIRPLFALMLCHALGGDKNAALVPACALELIHTYSMIHDDLPCMDNDDFRRGKPTLHKAYNDPLALLAGDYLLTYAFEVISTAKDISDSQKVQLTRILAQRSGAHGMIGGQVMDIESSHKSINLETLMLLHQLKTGALITAAVEFGGVLGRANDVQMNILQQFGREIGLAFQINDDIHDVTQSHTKHGKAIGSDVINNKTTYVTLLGIEKSQQKAQALLTSAIGKLKTLAVETSLVEEFANLIIYN